MKPFGSKRRAQASNMRALIYITDKLSEGTLSDAKTSKSLADQPPLLHLLDSRKTDEERSVPFAGQSSPQARTPIKRVELMDMERSKERARVLKDKADHVLSESNSLLLGTVEGMKALAQRQRQLDFELLETSLLPPEAHDGKPAALFSSNYHKIETAINSGSAEDDIDYDDAPELQEVHDTSTRHLGESSVYEGSDRAPRGSVHETPQRMRGLSIRGPVEVRVSVDSTAMQQNVLPPPPEPVKPVDPVDQLKAENASLKLELSRTTYALEQRERRARELEIQTYTGREINIRNSGELKKVKAHRDRLAEENLEVKALKQRLIKMEREKEYIFERLLAEFSVNFRGKDFTPLQTLKRRAQDRQKSKKEEAASKEALFTELLKEHTQEVTKSTQKKATKIFSARLALCEGQLMQYHDKYLNSVDALAGDAKRPAAAKYADESEILSTWLNPNTPQEDRVKHILEYSRVTSSHPFYSPLQHLCTAFVQTSESLYTSLIAVLQQAVPKSFQQIEVYMRNERFRVERSEYPAFLAGLLSLQRESKHAAEAERAKFKLKLEDYKGRTKAKLMEIKTKKSKSSRSSGRKRDQTIQGGDLTSFHFPYKLELEDDRASSASSDGRPHSLVLAPSLSSTLEPSQSTPLARKKTANALMDVLRSHTVQVARFDKVKTLSKG